MDKVIKVMVISFNCLTQCFEVKGRPDFNLRTNLMLLEGPVAKLMFYALQKFQSLEAVTRISKANSTAVSYSVVAIICKLLYMKAKMDKQFVVYAKQSNTRYDPPFQTFIKTITALEKEYFTFKNDEIVHSGCK